MAAAPSGAKTSSILRLRAGLLLLVTSIVLCGAGGHFVARQFGLGLAGRSSSRWSSGWSWAVALARLDTASITPPRWW